MNLLRAVKLRAGPAVLAVLPVTVTLAACGTDNTGGRGAAPAVIQHSKGDGFVGTLVDPPLIPAPVVLRDTKGEPYEVSRRSPGRATALFFGFTNCDDVCPTTMADLAAAKRALPTHLAQRVDVLFISVDPRRDTPRVLQRWLERFDPGFTGLRGSVQRVHRVERSLYADGSVKSPTGGHHDRGQDVPSHGHGSSNDVGYEVSHSGSVYVFGPRGESLLYSGGTTVGEYTQDLTRLLRRS